MNTAPKASTTPAEAATPEPGRFSRFAIMAATYAGRPGIFALALAAESLPSKELDQLSRHYQDVTKRDRMRGSER